MIDGTLPTQKSRTNLSFCVVVPMYNEQANAEKCVGAISDVLASLSPRSGLIAVNDGSTDRTGSILDQLQAEFSRLIVVTHEKNAGYGASIKTGIGRAAAEGYQYALFMDSDLTNDPKYIPDFLRKMEEGFDVIKASRYVQGGGMSGVPLHRRIISAAGNRLASRLMGLPIADVTNGFRALKVEVLSRMRLTERGFAVIMEELYFSKFLAKTYCEIPYLLTSRKAGEGASKFRYRPRIFWDYLKYALKAGLRIRPAGESPGKQEKGLV